MVKYHTSLTQSFSFVKKFCNLELYFSGKKKHEKFVISTKLFAIFELK
jgi:hypothetical protein